METVAMKCLLFLNFKYILANEDSKFLLKGRMHVCHWQRSNETIIISMKKII